MKASIKIATRLNSTTVCRPTGLPQFARVGGPEYVYSTKSVSTRAPGSRAACYLTDYNETLPV